MSEHGERHPENVRMVVNGHEIPCDVRRVPEEDHEDGDGELCRAWLVSPRPGEGMIVEPGFSLAWRAGYLPAHACLLFDIEVPQEMMN